MSDEFGDEDDIKNLFTNILGSKVTIKDNIASTEESVFVTFINRLEESRILEDKIFEMGDIDLTRITDPLWFVIENQFKFLYGVEASELIIWYLYERTDLDGRINPIIDENEKEFILETPKDLWSYIKFNFLPPPPKQLG